MDLNDEKRVLLELNVFKGKILKSLKGRGGLIYIVERNCIPKFVAYKTTQEFERLDISNIRVESIVNIEREAGNWFRYSNHPLLITPFSVTLVNNFPIICMPCCNGDLSFFTRSEQEFTSVIFLSLQIIKGLIEANKAGLKHHQDLKPENILYIDLSKKFKNYPPIDVDPFLRYSVRIADFGVANAYLNGHPGGTNVYKAPEQYDIKLFSECFEPDIFAVGIIIAELFQGYHPAALDKDNDNKIRNWTGKRLKNWTLSGTRNYKAAESDNEVSLIKLIDEMLSPNPSLRPSFESCYSVLSEILRLSDAKSFEFLDALISHYDRISNISGIQGRLFNLISLSKIKSQLTSILEKISFELDTLMSTNIYNAKKMIAIFHYAKALYIISHNNGVKEFHELMISAFESIVYFLLEHPEDITSSQLHPVIDNSISIGSDFESSAEVFNESLKILSFLNYAGELNILIRNSTDNVVKAFVIFGVAQDLRLVHRHDEAYQKLSELRLLIPIDSKFEEVFAHWKKEIVFWSKFNHRTEDE
ncbi:TPA: protein kinase domain-containing protein [Providencia alcalifaciens]